MKVQSLRRLMIILSSVLFLGMAIAPAQAQKSDDAVKLVESTTQAVQGAIKKDHDKLVTDHKRLMELVDKTIKAFQGVNYLIPCSLKNSPCKRLFMFFRWMVRDDNIDLGLWKFIKAQELVIPLDTHIFRVSKELGLTRKKTSSLSTAMEITDNLKTFSQDDPVKYDWGLSHMGIIKNNFGDLL